MFDAQSDPWSRSQSQTHRKNIEAKVKTTEEKI